MSKPKPITATIIGNPFAPIGRGIAALNLFRALQESHYPVSICDITSHNYHRKNRDVRSEIGSYLVPKPGKGINIFVINGDEIETTRKLLGDYPTYAYNIIYPSWELEKYPMHWAKQIESFFDEVWVPSKFLEESLSRVCYKPVLCVPHPIYVKLRSFLTRRYFGLPESSYIFLFMFDLKSYIERKNPIDFLRAFEKLIQIRPSADVRAVIKVSGVDTHQKGYEKFIKFNEQVNLSKAHDRIILFTNTFSENETKNLIRNCDCFVSLHRSEGFGLAIAEAMLLGKPVIATNYSGNLEFMTKNNSFLVDYNLIPVQEDEYPYSTGQVWANPNINQAIEYMISLIENKNRGQEVGEIASRDIRVKFSLLSIGLKVSNRLNEISQKFF
ncbi:MAG: glycosyltransferase family 4 protein [Anaerolineales bacterium]|jgi:glycosyltransferase involved in cell wall biosynthesis